MASRIKIMTKIAMVAFLMSALIPVSNVLADEYPSKPITVIVAYGAGGNTDVGARILLPFVEKELGVPLTIVNKPGGGGWVGWTKLLNAKKDGYTIGYINTPNLITGYLDPQFKRDKNLDDFALISNHVTDYGCISINKEEKRFSNIKELIEFAKNNDVTASTTGANGDDHIAMLKLNQHYGTHFIPVHTKGSANQRAAIIGGHVDVNFSNVGDTNIAHKDGELKIVAVMAPERSRFLPEVPTLEESGYPKVYSWSSRGLSAPKGIAPEKLEILKKAFEKGLANAEHLQKMEAMGLQVDVKTGSEYRKMLDSEEQGVLELKSLLGW